MKADHGQFITVLYPGKAAGDPEASPAACASAATRLLLPATIPSPAAPGRASPSNGRGKEVLSLDGREIDLDRSQGDIGLFVPDAGYPFGDIPDWLIRQRAGRPAAPKD